MAMARSASSLLLRFSQRKLNPRIFLSTTPAILGEAEAVKGQLLLSDSCVKRLQQICTDRSFLRVVVEGGGCSGFQYKLEMDKNLSPEDLQFGSDGAKVVIDETSIEYVDGSTVDYHEELIRAGFRIINNPKAEGGCSCGASFNIKLD